LTVLSEERGGLSDGNFICHALPTLDGMGPNGDNAHCSEQSDDGTKEQEFVDVASILPKATLNTLAILKLVKS
jgi:glutamate carboxypeptidase